MLPWDETCEYQFVRRYFRIYQRHGQNYASMHCWDALWPRKLKEGICCSGHLGVTYGAELLYLQSFFVAKLPSKCELPSLHNGYCEVNHAVMIVSADRAKLEGAIEYQSVMSSNFHFCIAALSWLYFSGTWWKTLSHQIWHKLVHNCPRYDRMNT